MPMPSTANMSTIQATVHEKMPIIASQPGHNVIAEAFKNMWRNFVRLVVLGIELLGVAIPAALVLAGAWWLVKRWRKRLAFGSVGQSG